MQGGSGVPSDGAAASADVIVTSGSRAGVVVASGTGVGAGVGVVAGTFFWGEKTFSTAAATRSRIGERGAALGLATTKRSAAEGLCLSLALTYECSWRLSREAAAS